MDSARGAASHKPITYLVADRQGHRLHIRDLTTHPWPLLHWPPAGSSPVRLRRDRWTG